MTTRIIREDTGMILLPKAAMQDHGLSFTARGILLEILSNDAGDTLGDAGFADQGHEDDGQISTALRLLIDHGYITRTPSGLLAHEQPQNKSA